LNNNEVAILLARMSVSYPSFKVDESMKEYMIAEWTNDLKNYEPKIIFAAFEAYKKTNRTGFAPAVGQILAFVDDIQTTDTAAEAWAKVRKAISRASYYSQEEFDKLPPLVQRAVGSPQQLITWARDEDYNEGVESSNFKKVYAQLQSRENNIEKMNMSLGIEQRNEQLLID